MNRLAKIFIPLLLFGFVFGLARVLLNRIEYGNVYAGVSLAVLIEFVIIVLIRSLMRRCKSLKCKVIGYSWVMLFTLFSVLLLLNYSSLLSLPDSMINIVFFTMLLFSAIVIFVFRKENII